MLEIKRGVLHLHSEKPAINPTASLEEAAKVAESQSSAEYLENVFFKDSRSVLFTDQLPSGGRVSVVAPSGPYSEEEIMVVAAGPDSLKNSPVPTETVYDYPIDTQEAYWRAIITALDVLKNEDTTNSQKVMAVENCIAERTSDKARTSRTIPLAHAKVLRLDEEHIAEEAWNMPGLAKEQRVLRMAFSLRDSLQAIKEQYAQNANSQLEDIKLNLSAPFGYSFTVGSPENIENVAAVLRNHHQAYRQVAQEAVTQLKESNRQRLIPQPSYRLYLTLEDGVLRADISPEFLSHAGVMEAAGVKLDRDVEHPRRISKEDLYRLQSQIVDTLKSTWPVPSEA